MEEEDAAAEVDDVSTIREEQNCDWEQKAKTEAQTIRRGREPNKPSASPESITSTVINIPDGDHSDIRSGPKAVVRL